MVRLVLPERQRWRFDAAARRAWLVICIRGEAIWHWRSRRRHAERLAREAIDRAADPTGRRRRRDGSWQGNVYVPKSFRKPRRPDKLH